MTTFQENLHEGIYYLMRSTIMSRVSRVLKVSSFSKMKQTHKQDFHRISRLARRFTMANAEF